LVYPRGGAQDGLREVVVLGRKTDHRKISTAKLALSDLRNYFPMMVSCKDPASVLPFQSWRGSEVITS
jgi:hypothetical protein